MSKISSVISLRQKATTTALALAAIFIYSSRTSAQAPEAPDRATPQSGCLFGYLNGTYQGDRPVTRNEFAAGLNACLNQVNQLIPTNRALATRADFEALIRRQRELNAELRELSGRADNLPTGKLSQPSEL